eukprot:Blabericola_migrator_1__7359@NODE_3740_length_1543_cov_8_516260_g1257_i2_p1_GENE_NODE_3740_length_1543_cov_8_516260_g1257_i2NODE_3740_length_1543_cov_8_516260_g1257_i2_p1_ORF_typecomplete_len118_score22_36_NODE_3740_length_1543_cov_8_516260_g1257_i2637990
MGVRIATPRCVVVTMNDLLIEVLVMTCSESVLSQRVFKLNAETKWAIMTAVIPVVANSPEFGTPDDTSITPGIDTPVDLVAISFVTSKLAKGVKTVVPAVLLSASVGTSASCFWCSH